MNSNSNLRCSPRGQEFIKSYEKLSLESYWDKTEKRFVIGWRHTGASVYQGKKISLDRAKILFLRDLKNEAELYVQKYIETPLSQDQFDALCSLTFSAGYGAVESSKIRLYVNKENFSEAMNAWLSYGSLTDSKSLQIRRRAEVSLFKSESTPIKRETSIKTPLKEEQINKSKFVEYVHSGGTYSVQELLNQDSFIVKRGQITESELLGVTYQNKTNHRRLYESSRLKETYSKTKNYLVTNGVTLIIPNSKIDIGIRFESNFLVSQNDSSLFFPKILRQMSIDPGYVIKYKNTKSGYLRNQSSVLTVFVWSRTSYLQDGGSGYLDLTKDVQSVTTSNSTQGRSSFTLSLNSTQANFEEGRWVKKGIIDLSSGQQVTKTSLNYIDGNRGYRKRSSIYYKEILSKNDLVFISFEELGIESNRKEISSNWYDMIGMIDSVQVNTSANNQIQVTINGRSLVKVLESDNSYFNPYSVGHSASIFGETPFSTRRFLDGRYHNLDSVLSRSIVDSIKFIFHQISSIGFVPNDIFSNFQNLTVVSRSEIKLNNKKVEQSAVSELYKNVHVSEQKEVKGIWQIMKLFVDDSVRDLRVVDDSISNPNGTIYDLIKKVAQEPFVEMFTDTYGDKFYIILRRPPFDQDAILSFLSNFINEEESQAYGPEVHSGEGSDILTFNDSQLHPVNLSTVVLSKGSKTLEVTEDMVINESLSYSDESYSWFQLTDKGNYAGASVYLGIFPGVYFDDYAQVFGNTRFSVISNYSNLDFWSDKSEGSRLDLYAKHASELLGWLIETHIYLPFTRTGSITIQGDRRFKAGTFLHYIPTDEVFYIKEVTHQLSVGVEINRVTTLSVERGMVKSFIYGSQETESGESLSYFNLVNIKQFKKSYYKIVSGGTAEQKFDYKSGLSINKEVFDFFLKKRQSIE